MPIEDFFQTMPLGQVVIDTPNRQRKDLGDIPDLAKSIRERGLLHPIVIKRENREIISGERRLTAHKWLDAEWAKENPARVAAGEQSPWATVPFRYFDSLDPTDAQVVELEENLKRKELKWQEVSEAVRAVHELFLAKDPEQTGTKTAEHIGMEISLFRKHLIVSEEILKGNKAVIDSVSIHEAYNKVKRGLDRATGEQINQLLAGTSMELGVGAQPTVADAVAGVLAGFGAGAVNPATPHAETPATPATPRPTPGAPHVSAAPPAVSAPVAPAPLPIFLNTDFIQWADNYTGQPFNFIHCDFPYGINHQKSKQGRVAEYGEYADSEDVYWELLNALARNKSKLIYPSSHMVFWFSMNFYSKTMEFMEKHFPEFTFDPFPLIWWKDRGIAPDASRRPRRVYETALFGFSGDRKLVSTRTNLVQAAGGTVKIHASEKPAPMLARFFQMVVDRHTRMLDPTCGSGASVRAAKALGAGTTLGIERDPNFYAGAVQAFQMAQALNFAGIIPKDSDEDGE